MFIDRNLGMNFLNGSLQLKSNAKMLANYAKIVQIKRAWIAPSFVKKDVFILNMT